MLNLLAFFYGIHVVLLIYLFSYLTARGALRGLSLFSILFILVKYFIFWEVLAFGFKRLPANGIIAGMFVGLYLSLPILYWINKKASDK